MRRSTVDAVAIAAAYILIMLHQLDGTVLWVETAHLQIIKTVGCEGKAGSAIRVGGGAFCVRETAEQIRAKITDGK